MSEQPCRTSEPASISNRLRGFTEGAFGAGLVLIVLPSAALILGLTPLGDHPVIGLPLLAIFGIMILFGALALISTVFARLGLSCRGEALALPPGSIRAAIALALIVLFALISVMLYQSLSRPYDVPNLTFAQKEAMVKEPSNHVLGVMPQPCKPPARAAASAASAASATAPGGSATPAAPADCTPEEMLYTVHLRQSPGTEATDLAKQLLILIGTLMTSVTSFYFASRSTEAATKSIVAALTPKPPAGSADAKASAEQDGCDVPIENPTSDVDLPQSKGGVAS